MFAIVNDRYCCKCDACDVMFGIDESGNVLLTVPQFVFTIDNKAAHLCSDCYGRGLLYAAKASRSEHHADICVPACGT